MVDNDEHYSIGAVERDTGIGRDTLRVWERRYGFPEPVRNEKGERTYPEAQLRRLQRVRRLLDQGLRPGKLVPLGEDALDQLEADLTAFESESLDPIVTDLVDAVTSADADKVKTLLNHAFEQQGLECFIFNTVVPLLTAVGELWARGRLQIYQEHFLSNQLVQFLNSEISRLQKTAKKPVVLLATLPGEEHTMGLLMVAALLSSRGIAAVNLGSDVPMEQIAR
ncbi:MAG: MerR family transcriptional regulator, partial [Gammaproteobacteria bacterium]|nr:MerR family transcriptional regulator [Gammaproteobacteria bacterium]